MSKAKHELYKQCIVLVMVVIMIFSFGSIKAGATDTITATPTSQSILFYPDGDQDKSYPVLLPLYQIKQNNYAKLRDVADVIDFNVTWNADRNVIEVISDEPFDKLQSTVGQVASAPKATMLSSQPIYIDGKLVSNLTMYVIEGNNYIKLRDLAAAINFGCRYDATHNTISLCSSHGYSADNIWGERKDISNISPNSPPVPKEIMPEPIYDENAEENDFADEVIRLVNQERIKAGLSALYTDKQLTEAAQIRANELGKSFSHDRPDGTSSFTVLDEMDISYTSAGENLYKGSSVNTPLKAVEGWMKSPGHRGNILKEAFTTLGVGYLKINNIHYWSQVFIG